MSRDYYLITNEVAKLLGKDSRTIRDWIYRKKLKATKFGPIWKIDKKEVKMKAAELGIEIKDESTSNAPYSDFNSEEMDCFAPNPHKGSSLDDFLEDEGILEECEMKAKKNVKTLKKDKK